MLAGDKRSYPVLAYSKENNFDVDPESYPEGLQGWLGDVESYIKEYIPNDTIIDRLEVYKVWTSEEIARFITLEPTGEKIDVSTENGFASKSSASTSTTLNQPYLMQSYGPLLSTEWGQGLGFNNFAPNLGCGGNGRAPAGCVATAMAQVMSHYQHPSSYNWSIMPDEMQPAIVNSNGANEISQLMFDTATSVNMNFQCGGSGAYTSDAANALRSTFGYSSAQYVGYMASSVFTENKSGYPVILRGTDTSLNVAHAWVAEGSRAYGTPVIACHPLFGGCTQTVQVTYTHYMNWGWEGLHDAWYTSDWTLPSRSYTSSKKMIWKIRK